MDPVTENIKIYQRTKDNKTWKMKVCSIHTPISCEQSVNSVSYVLEEDRVPRMSWTVNFIWPNNDHGFNQFLKDFGCKALLSKVVLPGMNEKESQAVVNNLAGVNENECVNDMIERFATDMHNRGIIILEDIFFQTPCSIHANDPTTLKPDLEPFRWFDHLVEKMIQQEKEQKAKRNKMVKGGIPASGKNDSNTN